MAHFIWDQKFSVGVKTLDNQHKHLFEILNRLYAALENKESIENISDIFDQVLEYTLAHFGIEEQYMLHAKYPGYNEHKALHEKLKTKATQIAASIRKGDLAAAEQASQFMKTWWEDHILKVDMKYTSHVKVPTAQNG